MERRRPYAKTIRLPHRAHFARAALLSAALCLAASAGTGLAGSGCSSDDSDGAAASFVDPGGTYGAEVTVIVSGRGRVLSATPGINCPDTCFTKYIFKSNTADGATGGLALKAIPTPGANFKGWHFDNSPTGTAGRGPGPCNPLQRPSATPPGSTSSVDLTLPFGETTGTPPIGQEGACAGSTAVPLSYKVTAEFDSDLPSEAGPDSGGPSEDLYVGPTGTVVGDLGAFSGYLYFAYTSAVGTGISYFSSPTSTTQQTPFTVLSASPGTLLAFDVSQYGLVYQTTTGLYAVRSGSIATPMSGAGALSCIESTMDSSGNVFCRTSTSILGWGYPSYLTQTTYASGLPSGSGLGVDPSFFYFGTTSAIDSLPRTVSDAGAPGTFLVSAISPSNLYVTPTPAHIWWLDSTQHFQVTSSTTAPVTASDTLLPVGTYTHFAADPSSSASFWVASSSAIYKASYPPLTPTPFRSGLSNIGAMAVDSTYVYWSEGATIKRARKAALGGF